MILFGPKLINYKKNNFYSDIIKREYPAISISIIFNSCNFNYEYHKYELIYHKRVYKLYFIA